MSELLLTGAGDAGGLGCPGFWERTLGWVLAVDPLISLDHAELNSLPRKSKLKFREIRIRYFVGEGLRDGVYAEASAGRAGIVAS